MISGVKPDPRDGSETPLAHARSYEFGEDRHSLALVASWALRFCLFLGRIFV